MDNNESKINIEAEKTVFSESIGKSEQKLEMIQPSFSQPKFEIPPFENLGRASNDNSTIPSINIKPSFMESPVSPDPYSSQNMAMLAMDANINTTPITPAPTQSRMIPMQANTGSIDSSKTSNIENQIKNNIMPSLQKIAQQVNDMNVSSKNQNISIEERPTIPPTNLIFIDRATKASSPPLWA